MANAMKVLTINKETIKPRVPTPNHLRTYCLSYIDQLAPFAFVPIVLLYPCVGSEFHKFHKFSRTLKTSLAEALTKFPPLAGKIKDNASVDCNDDGVACFETRVDWSLDELLSCPRNEYLKRLVVVVDDDSTKGCLFSVQINLFKCGGVAIGVSFSHKLCDAASINTFLKCWSALALGIDRGDVNSPDSTVSLSLPTRKDIPIWQPDISSKSNTNRTTRLVFDGSKVTSLRMISASPNTSNPTRVEAVTALIWKCAMKASKSNRKSYSEPYLAAHCVNMRKKLIPSLPETAYGNVIGIYVATSETSDAQLDVLVDSLRKKRNEYDDFIPKLRGDEGIATFLGQAEWARGMLTEGVTEVHVFSSWCSFPFYEVNFGIGKPIWVGIAMPPHKNFNALMDTKDGKGIQAYVTLSDEDMSLIECDPLLLAYASLNPAV